MTASRMWALIVGLIVCGGALVGTVVYRQQHPDAEIAKLVAPLTPPAPSPSKPAALPGGPDVARPGATKSDTLKSDSARPEVANPEIANPEAAKHDAAKPEAAKQKPGTEPASGNGEPPHFDVVRVEPTGDAVLAGKGDPNAKVALVEQGKVVAETKADPSGHFVLLPPSLKPGDHDLTLRQTTDGKPTEDSKQNVAVSVPQKGSGQVVVALAEPGKPTKVLSAPEGGTAATANAPPAPTPPEAAAPPPVATPAPAQPETAVAPPPVIAPKGPDLAIRTAELENGNGFYATGVAAPGTPVEIYLNGAHLAQVEAGPDGQWSVTVKKGLTPGHYAVRADATDADHKVIARVEVPFDVPVAMAEAPKTDAPAASPKVATADPDAPAPPSAPNPGDPSTNDSSPSVSATPQPSANEPSVVPTPRPDIAAAAKAASQAAPDKAPPALAVSPPVANPPAPAPDKMAVAPPKPADAPPAMTAAAPSAVAPTSTEKPKIAGANAVIEQVETALVVRGDNLWNISRAKLGRGMRYTQIYAANTSQIRDPRLIFPGQVFVLPRN